MAINPGTKFPHFSTNAVVSLEPGQEFATFDTAAQKGKWLVFYTYPKDFTFVCPTEIAEFDAKQEEFDKRGAVVFGGSTDNEFSHLAWRKDNVLLKGLRHPLVFVKPESAQELGLIHPVEGVALRATILVDPEGVVRHASVNDLSVGRNVDETLRILDGLQTGELVACNWKPGTPTLTEQLKK